MHLGKINMSRVRREFKRTSGVRDAKLFVIATEGQSTEPKYFKSLINFDENRNSRIHVEIIPSSNGKSSPRHVLESLNDFKQQYRIREDDELWMVVDRDSKSWNTKTLSLCYKESKQKKFYFAISNPSFELWIILHLVCIDSEIDEEKLLILENKKTGSRTYSELKIIKELGAYNKSNPDFSKIIPKTALAISRAKKLTKNDSIDLFDNLGTSVYILVEKLTNAI